jgi:simple sugar transport system permease protein
LNYLIYGPWKDPKGFNFPLTAIFPKSSWLPEIGNTGIHIGIIIVLILVFIVYFIMKKTQWGFELKIIGDNPKAARYSGISIEKNLILAMMFSGALAGLAGSIQVLGVQHRLQHGFSTGYGYTAIIVAWLARLNPIGAIIVGFFFGGLLVGGEQLQIVMKFPISMISALQGLILFSLLASETIFKYRLRFIKDDTKSVVN